MVDSSEENLKSEQQLFTFGKTKELYQSIALKGIVVCLYYGVLFALARRFDLAVMVVLFIVVRILFFKQKRLAARLFVLQVHLQMILLAYFGVTVLGWQFGSQYLLFCAISLNYMSPFKHSYVIAILGVIEGIVFIYLHFMYSMLPAKLVFPPPWDSVFFVLGVMPAIIMILYSGHKADLAALVHSRKMYSENLELKKIASRDELTGLYNRRSMFNLLDNSWQHYKNTGSVFFLAMADIDFFKNVNDKLGHDAGDYVLVELSRLFNRTLRQNDYVARWGGEEFLFLIVDAESAQNISEILERLRHTVEQHPFIWQEQKFQITLTVGCASCINKNTIHDVISTADDFLYEGKRSGRNRVIMR